MTNAERLAKKAELAAKVADINVKAPAALKPGTTKPGFKPVEHVPTKGIKAKVIKGQM